jgi:hypothetical protein
MARRPLMAFHALMWGGTIVVCFTIALLYFGYKGEALPRIPIRLTGDWLIEGDEEIGFVPVRNGSTEMDYRGGLRFHVFTDRLGARVNAPGAQTPEHVEVLAIGCSFTWGEAVESESTYVQQLGHIVDVPVANLGMGSYGSVQSFQRLRRNADLKPKVIVYGFIQDHLRRNLSPCAPNYVPYCLPASYLERQGDEMIIRRPHMEYFSPADNRAFMAEVAMRDPSGLRAWLQAAKWAARMELFKYRNAKTSAFDGSPDVAAAGIRAMIDAMVGEAHGMGARLVVLNLPYLPRGRVQPAPDALEAAVAGKDLTFVDFSPVAVEYYDRHATGTLTNGLDPHPSPAAHRMIAETLASVVGPLLTADARQRPADSALRGHGSTLLP